jgi:hypothetical protein
MRSLLALFALLPLPAAALTVTVRDCFEGAQFIENAAHARNNGISREAFVARLDEDLQLIQAYPPALRWFAQDEDDAMLLRAGVVQVFAEERLPQEHGARFLALCRSLARATADDATASAHR